MRLLTQHGGITPFRLTEIKRQEDADYLAAAKLLSEGNTLAGFEAIAAKDGWVKEVIDDATRYRQMAAEYVQALADKKTVLCISPTWAEARCITQEIRAELRAAGLLGTEEREFTRLVAANASDAERGLTTTYCPGDVLQFHQNAKGFKKGDRFIVTDPANVPLTAAKAFQLYRPEKLALSAGDRIRFTATVKTLDGRHRLYNGATHTVASFQGDNVRLENGWVVPASAGHWRSGFVESSFGSQGRTVDRVVLGMSSASVPAMNQEQLYVSSSRARERVSLYTDDVDAVRKAVVRSSQKLTASDIVPPKPKPIERVRWHMARLRRLAIIERVRHAWEAHRPQLERQVNHGRG